MTLTVEIPDVRIDEVRAFAQARGQELNDFVASAVLATIDDREAGTETDLDSVIEEAGRLYERGERGLPLDEAFANVQASDIKKNLRESDLLLRLQTLFPPEQTQEYQTLCKRRDTAPLPQTDHSRLLSLIEQRDHQNAERLEIVAELAQLRRVSLREMMASLGIRPN